MQAVEKNRLIDIQHYSNKEIKDLYLFLHLLNSKI
jgi:hypothetical protein